MAFLRLIDVLYPHLSELPMLDKFHSKLCIFTFHRDTKQSPQTISEYSSSTLYNNVFNYWPAYPMKLHTSTS